MQTPNGAQRLATETLDCVLHRSLAVTQWAVLVGKARQFHRCRQQESLEGNKAGVGRDGAQLHGCRIGTLTGEKVVVHLEDDAAALLDEHARALGVRGLPTTGCPRREPRCGVQSTHGRTLGCGGEIRPAEATPALTGLLSIATLSSIELRGTDPIQDGVMDDGGIIWQEAHAGDEPILGQPRAQEEASVVIRGGAGALGGVGVGESHGHDAGGIHGADHGRGVVRRGV